MHIITARSREGTVVRRIFPVGEEAYRVSSDGTISRCGSNKGTWVDCPDSALPAEVAEVLLPDRDDIVARERCRAIAEQAQAAAGI